ncbi:hypothetical protein [Sporosarcina sp. FA9]|uniref:hypothetical protein n=1 Tax=Sporosarcina sp. FA9 TaxID=3413030 RepID=UPI003F658465
MQNKTLIFSKVFRFVLLIVVGVLLSITLISYGVPRSIVFILIIVMYLAISILKPLHIIYKSKSIKTINRYVILNNKRPIFNYSYALGHGDDQDIENSLKRIINVYGQDSMRPIYSANLAIHQNKPKEVLEFVEQIDGSDYKNYYAGISFAMRKQYDKVEEFSTKIRTPWMSHGLKAVLFKEKKEYEGFQKEAALSISNAVGMQRYVMHHMMRRMEIEAFPDIKKGSSK